MKPSYLTVGRNRRTFVTPSLESRSIAITTHPTNYTVLNHCKLFTHIYTHHKPFSNSILSLSFLLFYTQSLISPLPLSLHPNPYPPNPFLPIPTNDSERTGHRHRTYKRPGVVFYGCCHEALPGAPLPPRPALPSSYTAIILSLRCTAVLFISQFFYSLSCMPSQASALSLLLKFTSSNLFLHSPNSSFPHLTLLFRFDSGLA